MIKRKLAECPFISHKDIAIAAEQHGQKQIALALLKNEKSIKDQVPILLSMKHYEVALNIAVNNGEIDIVYGILSYMRAKDVDKTEIINHCGKVDGCIPYLLSYARERAKVNNSDELLRAIYEYTAKPDDLNVGKRLIMEGVKEHEEYEMLSNALKIQNAPELGKALEQILTKTPKNTYTKIKPAIESYFNYLSYMLHDMKKKEIPISEEVASAQGTLEFLLLLAKDADKKEIASVIDGMAKKLKIEVRYVHMLKLRAFAMSENWGVFQELIKKEKPKLSPRFYAGLCIEFGNKELAVFHINMLPIVEEKVDMLLEIE